MVVFRRSGLVPLILADLPASGTSIDLLVQRVRQKKREVGMLLAFSLAELCSVRFGTCKEKRWAQFYGPLFPVFC